jgi:predicted RecB family endonuclease
MLDRAARRRVTAPPATGDVIAADASALLRVLERAAADPNSDVERLDRLATIYERMVSREAETKFNTALVKLQPKLPVLDERGEITGPDGAVRATYATWEDTVEAIGPILARHGFSLTFRPGRSPKGVPTVTGVLRHEGGHKEVAELELPADTSGDKNAVQAVGSTMSYGQRYVARMLLNLISRGEDDDGAAAGQSAAVADAIAEINQIETQAGFPDWKRKSRAKLAALAPGEFQQVIGCYSARQRRVQAKAAEAR